MKKILCAFMLLLCFGSTLWIEQATAKTVPFTIRNNNDWDAFRAEVKKARGQYYVDATLEADITTVYGVGLDADAPYRGTFDGNGHTLNVDIKHGNYPSALFCYAGDVTIKDLHLTGKISGGMHSAGLIGIAQAGTPTITINHVWVSTEVNTTASHAGGIIGHADRGNVYMNDCLFDGTVKTNNADGSFIGCIIGWANTPGSWCLDRVYNNPSTIPLAQRIYLCLYHHGTWKRWGSSERSFTISSINWSDWEVNHYNKKDQNEVVRLMNANSPNSWTIYEGKAVPIMNVNSNLSGYTEITDGSSNGYVLRSGHYYITRDMTFSNTIEGGSGISINSGATVYIHVPKGVTLTAIGHDASGQTGAGAGILLPQGSTLFLEGSGAVIAKGGNAANGSNGKK